MKEGIHEADQHSRVVSVGMPLIGRVCARANTTSTAERKSSHSTLSCKTSGTYGRTTYAARSSDTLGKAGGE